MKEAGAESSVAMREQVTGDPLTTRDFQLGSVLTLELFSNAL